MSGTITTTVARFQNSVGLFDFPGRDVAEESLGEAVARRLLAPLGTAGDQLGPRPVGHAYADELTRRFGRRPHLCQIDAVGGGGEKRRPYQLAEGVAIIDVSGVLVNEAWWYDETEYRQIQREVKQAVEDAEVKGILLRVASPGGETDSAFETAAVLAEAGQKKPLWAVTDPYAYSAGYLLASQAAKIYVPPVTGGVGSVGVYMLHLDYSERLKEMGVKPTFIAAGKGKTDGNAYEPLGEEALKRFKAEVDRLYGEFLGHVSRARKMPEESLRKLGAVCLYGSAAALGAGMADRAGTLEQAWYEFAEALAVPPLASSMAVSAAMTSQQEGTSVSETLKPEAAATGVAPVNIEQIRSAAEAGGLEKAKQRAEEINALCKMAGRPGLAGELIASSATLEGVREKLMGLAADEGGQEIHNKTMPGTGASVGLTAQNNPLIAACEAIAVRMKGGN